MRRCAWSCRHGFGFGRIVTCQWRTTSSSSSAIAAETRRCDSLAEAHVWLSATLQEHLARCRPMSLANMVHELRRWWHTAAHCLRVSRDLQAVPDFPLFLLDTLRATGDDTHAQDVLSPAEAEAAHGRQRFLQMSDEHILQEFEEWVVTSSPPRVAPAFAVASQGARLGNDGEAMDTISYVSLMGLVSSYIRYHAGVRWGASLPHAASASTAAERERSLAAYHRRVYYMHPWHDIYCPVGQAAQMPYVYVLQWMLAGARHRGRQTAADAFSAVVSRLPSAQGSVDAAAGQLNTLGGLSEAERRALWAEHRATRYFDPPCWSRESTARAGAGAMSDNGAPTTRGRRNDEGSGESTLAALCRSFSALDVCCQSGFAVDLLLRAGAHEVTATDALPSALGSTEATVQEHLRDRRSAELAVTGLRKAVHVQLSELVPHRATAVPLVPAAYAATNATAAARRRRLARQYDRALPAALPSRSASHTADGGDAPYDVLYYHPPPQPLLPMRALPWQPARKSAWWRQVAAAGRLYAATQKASLRLLPSVVSPVQGLHHPHAGTRRLHDLVELLRADVTRQRGATSLAAEPPALLQNEGYVVLILPSVFDPDELLQRGQRATRRANSPSAPPLVPSDWVVAQLDGLYKVILRRRHYVRGAGPTVAECDDDAAYASHRGQRQRQRPREPGADTALLRSLLEHPALSSIGAAPTSTLYEELIALYDHGEVWTDVLVMQKSSAAVREYRAACEAAHTLSRSNARYAAVQHMRQLQCGAACAAEWRRESGLGDAPNAEDDADDDEGTRGSSDGGRGGQVGVRWRDSLEYHEYKPRSTTPTATRYHWTDMLPSFSYLERDCWSGEDWAAAQSNYLAVGHPPQLVPTLPPPRATERDGRASGRHAASGNEGVAAVSASAAMRFRSVFAEELRTRRRPKLRKLATASLQQQEWFIDEKLIKSEAAKVDFMNELARWDLKDYD